MENSKLNIAAEYAYMNLNNVSDAAKVKILESRNTIINSKSWTIDGFLSLVEANGTLTPLPEFYDIFPADWEIPAKDVTSSAPAFSANNNSINAVTASDLPSNGWVGSVFLYPYTTDGYYGSFRDITPTPPNNGRSIEIWASYIAGSPYMYNVWCFASRTMGQAIDCLLGTRVHAGPLVSGTDYHCIANTNWSGCVGNATLNVKYA